MGVPEYDVLQRSAFSQHIIGPVILNSLNLFCRDVKFSENLAPCIPAPSTLRNRPASQCTKPAAPQGESPPPSTPFLCPSTQELKPSFQSLELLSSQTVAALSNKWTQHVSAWQGNSCHLVVGFRRPWISTSPSHQCAGWSPRHLLWQPGPVWLNSFKLWDQTLLFSSSLN